MSSPSPAPPDGLPVRILCFTEGCRGVRVGDRTACLAHLDEIDLMLYLDTLGPGSDVDHHGTTFTPELLDRLLGALLDPDTGLHTFGAADFGEARFAGPASFESAGFGGAAVFTGAAFEGEAAFRRTRFDSETWFGRATFAGAARFGGASFRAGADFTEAEFEGEARFERADFTGPGVFVRAGFARAALFRNALFHTVVSFAEARFETAPELGPLACAGTVNLNAAVFGAPVTVDVTAAKARLERTQWRSTAALRLNCDDVDLSGAVMEFPVTMTASSAPFLGPATIRRPQAALRVTSLRDVDAAHLSLIDADLTRCRFAGTVHLDQIRLEGRTVFARPPDRWRRRGPLPTRWSKRRTLAEEHHWRAVVEGGTSPSWTPGPTHPAPPPGPETVAALYRQLRKALEDGKNEPGAADFYYGECEMRRHDVSGTPRAERWLLAAYWAVSGYGLRASRALAWLLAAMTVTVLAMMLWGLPAEEPKPTTRGRQVEAGQELVLTNDTPDPTNPSGPLAERLTSERFEKSLRVVINSTVFRSSGQDLTTAGTYVEMASRLSEPVLLGLAAFAVRARVKR
ncbi:pentapeptide repeat-containing protein [Streptomyces sp. 4N509B]|uniref:pentapeptide repeat-containing protein n=1 Tax=Streptomyces sp. 4N509B TaxID=3457413 RepID=UPI003FCEF9E2